MWGQQGHALPAALTPIDRVEGGISISSRIITISQSLQVEGGRIFEPQRRRPAKRIVGLSGGTAALSRSTPLLARSQFQYHMTSRDLLMLLNLSAQLQHATVVPGAEWQHSRPARKHHTARMHHHGQTRTCHQPGGQPLPHCKPPHRCKQHAAHLLCQ